MDDDIRVVRNRQYILKVFEPFKLLGLLGAALAHQKTLRLTTGPFDLCYFAGTST